MEICLGYTDSQKNIDTHYIQSKVQKVANAHSKDNIKGITYTVLDHHMSILYMLG